ncbi:MAG: prepilin-type N-terminal cleavage/methylation domain-containing protein [Candidatus Levybacteria bacterium]|nr:prepilin-type N-terminal cleavage/methylation domain-containing protein [Candidatus Levybacteria bacterium]
MNKHPNWQKGETLIEALGALAIVAIVITAVTMVITTALSNALFNENQTLATKFAQQGIETVRQVRNTDYSAYRSYNGLYCLGKGQTTLGTPQSRCSTPNADTFIRSVTIEQSPGCAPNVSRVIVRVAFTSGKCQPNTYCHAQTHTSCLSTVNPNKGL